MISGKFLSSPGMLEDDEEMVRLSQPARRSNVGAMNTVAATLRITLKFVILATMIVVGLMLAYILLPFLFPVALLLGILLVLRFCWRILTPRPRCCETCASTRRGCVANPVR